MSSAISQLSSFSSINRSFQFRRRQLPCPSFRPKLLVVMSLEDRGAEASSLETKTSLSFENGAATSYVEGTVKSYPIVEDAYSQNMAMNKVGQDDAVTQPKRAAKIHDFCFGIPYGGLVLSGGFVGFIFSRNPASLGTSVLFGGALLALSTLSLKIWRQGKSSIPFILGQAVLSAALLWKNLQAYSLTKKLLPAGYYVILSTFMLCFYSYVAISGGNPPPKKKNLSAAVST